MVRNGREIRLGVVSASANRSWAKLSLVPTIKTVTSLKFAAVTVRSEYSADEAAQAFGAERGSFDPFAMIQAGTYSTPAFFTSVAVNASN
jgi:predicted dehydrogenase